MRISSVITIGVITGLLFGAFSAAAAAPDLFVLSVVRYAYTPIVGEAVSFDIKIKNIGDTLADGSLVEIRIDGTFLTRLIGSLGAGATEVASFSWTPLNAGTYRVEACADIYNSVAESNESNNCLSQTFNVEPVQKQPTVDLKINGSDGTITVNSGASAILSWTSSNVASCFASGSWSGARPTSGSENTGPIPNFQSFTLTCDGFSDSVSANVTTQPTNVPTVSLTANPPSVSRGNGATLRWSSSNADSCFAYGLPAGQAGGWSEARALSGSQFVVPSQTTTYFLSCSNSAGSNSASATITVTDVQPTVNLTASPQTISRGNAAALSWSSSNADECFAYGLPAGQAGGWSGFRATSGSQTVAPERTTTYFITCTNQSGSASASATVSVAGTTAGTPPTVDLDAQPRNISEGESSVLFWTSSNADSCFASGGWSGAKALAGSEIVYPTRLTLYTLVCTNEAGSAVGNITIFIRTIQGSAPTVNLDANPVRINPGTPVILVWSSTNADTCLASGGWSGAKSRAGSETATPTINTTYTLICSNENGVASASRTIFIGFTAVSPPPAPSQQFRAACVASPRQARIGESITFAGGETGGTSPVTFNWSGVLSGTGLVRTASFSTTGLKTTLLTVIDSSGRSAVASCSVDIVAPAPAAPTTPTVTPPPAAPPVTLTFRNVPAPEAAEEEQPFLATIFGEGIGRLLAILFLILANLALFFFLFWLYQRTKKERKEALAMPARLASRDQNLPQEFLEPEIS